MNLARLTQSEAYEIFDRISWWQDGVHSGFDFTRPNVRAIMNALTMDSEIPASVAAVARTILRIKMESDQIAKNFPINKDAVTLQNIAYLQRIPNVYYSNLRSPSFDFSPAETSKYSIKFHRRRSNLID